MHEKQKKIRLLFEKYTHHTPVNVTVHFEIPINSDNFFWCLMLMMAFEKHCCTNDSDEYWMEFILFFVYSFLHSMTSFNAFFFLQKNLNKIPNFLYMCISLLLRTIIDMDRCHVTLRVASHGKIFMHTILNIHNTNSTFCKQIRSNSWEHKRRMPSVLSFVCSFIWLKSDNPICIRLLSRSFFFILFSFPRFLYLKK